MFMDDESIQSRIDKSLSIIVYKKTKARKGLDGRVRKFHVFEGKNKSVEEYNNEIETTRNELTVEIKI